MMKKRLRKKKGLKEFQEAGFEFFANFKCEDEDQFINEFSAIVEKHKVFFQGHFCDCEQEGGEEHIEGFVTVGLITTSLNERRDAFVKDLTEKLALTNVKTGDWEDANYEGKPIAVK